MVLPGRRWLVLAGIALVCLGCHASVSVGTKSDTVTGPPRIESVELARDFKDGKPVGQTTAFPADSTFHAVVRVSAARNDTRVKAGWTAVDAGGEQNRIIDEKEVTGPGDQAVDFTLSLPRPWPPGSYKVDIYLDGKLERSVDFTVQ